MRYVPAPGLLPRDPRNAQRIGGEGVEVGPFDFDLVRMVEAGELVPAAIDEAPAAPAAEPLPDA